MENKRGPKRQERNQSRALSLIPTHFSKQSIKIESSNTEVKSRTVTTVDREQQIIGPFNDCSFSAKKEITSGLDFFKNTTVVHKRNSLIMNVFF